MANTKLVKRKRLVPSKAKKSHKQGRGSSAAGRGSSAAGRGSNAARVVVVVVVLREIMLWGLSIRKPDVLLIKINPI